MGVCIHGGLHPEGSASGGTGGLPPEGVGLHLWQWADPPHPGLPTEGLGRYPSPVDRQTPVKTLPCPKLCLRAVITVDLNCYLRYVIFHSICHAPNYAPFLFAIQPMLFTITIVNYYRPQCSCGMVMFLYPSVILSTGACLAFLFKPWADTPWQIPPGQTPPPPTPETATVADGTYPTEMHSCLNYFCLFCRSMNNILHGRRHT